MAIARIVVLVVLSLLVFAPALAAAASNCAGMSADCEGPCGTTTGLSTGLAVLSRLHASWLAAPVAGSDASAAPVRLIDLPPRP